MCDVTRLNEWAKRQPGMVELRRQHDYEMARARMQEQDKLGEAPRFAREAQDISDAVPRRQ